MSTQKTIFVCTKCDFQTPKWAGRCTECGNWSTLKEVPLDQALDSKAETSVKFDDSLLVDFHQIKDKKTARLKTNINEVDNVLGGGIAQGSLILLGGEPGIGKSTIVLQLAEKLQSDSPVLYASGEESAQQIKMRIDRLKINHKKLKYLGQTKVETIKAAIEDLKPSMCIVDSIQTIYSPQLESEPGSVSQVRACTVKLLESAKKTNIPIIIVGHVTKDGQVAGPKTLEHLVDVVLYLEGDKFQQFRILRSNKNRFGSTSEIGIFDMQSQGLIEVANPSEYFLTSEQINYPGRTTTCIIEGSRSFLVEVQALVTKTIFGYPQRKTSGYDLNRLQLLSAVINKRTSINLINQDIHLNITSGLKIQDPSIDLAVISAIASSFNNKAINSNLIAIGEVGLGGEIRPVAQLEKRLKEAENLRYKQAMVQSKNAKSNLQIVQVNNIGEAMEKLF